MPIVDVLGAVGVVLYGVASLVVGVRLLRLGLHTRQLPELALGAGFTVGVLCGYIPENVALSTDLLSADGERAILYVAQVAIRAAALAVLVFTWRVFRKNARWALGLVLLLGGALLASYALFPLTESYATTAAEHRAAAVYKWSRSLCLLWGALESARYFVGSRKRLAIGLGDRLLTQRFLLWSVAMAGSALIMGSTLLASLVGADAGHPAWVMAESVVGLVAAVCIWLTFFPTRAYLRWVRREAGAAA